MDSSALHNRMWWTGWWLVHKHLDQETRQSIIFPCSFAGLEVKGQSTSESVFFFDSLAFYQEKLTPLIFEPRPTRNITLFQGQSPGLNTGPGRLSFPTREDTILPSNFESDYQNSVKRLKDGIFRFEYEGKDAKIVYMYRPREGILGEITAHLNGERVSRPLDGGGVHFIQELLSPRLRSVSLEGNMVTAIFAYGDEPEVQEMKYRLQIKQKSLIIDVIVLRGKAVELSLGHISEVENPRLVSMLSFHLQDGAPPIPEASSNPPVSKRVTG